MSKRDTLQKIMNVGAGLAGAYFVGIAIAGAIKRRREQKAVGKVERVKRRIYKEVSMAQQAGVDFSKKFPELTTQERQALERVGHDVGWKQSKRSVESGKPYVESYYGSLRRAWNAVSGISGIGATSYDVYDRDGNVCLTWTDVTDHIEHEPEAKVLLALPPHVEEKKKRKKKINEEEYWERFSFAKDFLDGYINKHPSAREYLFKQLLKQHYKGKWDINDVPDYAYDGLIISFALKELKVQGNNIYFLGDKFSTYGTVTSAAGRAAEELLEAWNNRYIEQGFQRDDLDDIRRELLDRAKLMQVVINTYPEYEDKTHRVKYYEPKYDREAEKIVHDYGDTVSGDDRYNYLDKINYVVWTSRREYGNGGMTYYPIRSYPDYEGAEIFVLNKYGKTGARVIPVWDVPIEKITGLN